MTSHRVINFALILLVIYLLAYFGPHLDESACLLGACSIIRLDEEMEPLPFWELCLFWGVVAFMLLCTVVVLLAGFGYLSLWMGWL